MVKNYHVDNVTIEEILGWIKQGKIGLPEMQRPFVWSTAKVRDLIDSLYNGYPIGYIVTWQNPAIGLKNDSSSNNKEIIIDGQQRLTALKAALSGEKVVSQQYITKRIKISFKPSTGEFNTLNSAIEKDPLWINDISDIFKSDFNSYSYVTDNAKKLGMAPEDLGATLQKLLAIRQSEIGDINQIANYVWVTQPKNLEISDKAPKDYLSDENIIEFMSETNNRENAIPEEIVDYDFHNYSDFLNQRRHLMAKKMREFYENM